VKSTPTHGVSGNIIESGGSVGTEVDVAENVDGSMGRTIGEEGGDDDGGGDDDDDAGEVDTGPSLTIPTSIMA
jgi:hypothetical protein